MKNNIVKIGRIRIGKGCPLVLIAGPCVIENEKSTLFHAEALSKLAVKSGIPFIFKASYDKANRTSISSFRGPGLKKGLKILQKVKDEFGVPVLSDVHCAIDVEAAAGVLDIIQIPAFLCRQTDLIIAAAKSGKIVNIKKGQFLSPFDMKHIIGKLEKSSAKGVLLTERGTSFGYNNLVSDFRSLQVMRELAYPVIYDATHSVQLPGGRGLSSDGQSEFIFGLSRAAVAMGVDGLFLEAHKNPKQALSDGPNMISLKELPFLIKQILTIKKAVKNYE
ncbi:MAG: 3-deoxy-8-phosphooctulonate synthase [Candidatus Omnitrophota bacterium]